MLKVTSNALRQQVMNNEGNVKAYCTYENNLNNNNNWPNGSFYMAGYLNAGDADGL